MAHATKILHRDYIPRNKITRDHIIGILGPTSSKNNNLIEKTLQDVTRLKVDALDFFRERVRAMMVGELMKQDVRFTNGGQVRTLLDLKGYIRKESLTILFFEKLFHVCYGIFYLTLNWAEAMEINFMNKENLVYGGDAKSDQSEHYKSCFVILVRKAKMEIVRSIQVLCEKSRGIWLTLDMKKNQKDIRKRRRFGAFYQEFIRSKK